MKHNHHLLKSYPGRLPNHSNCSQKEIVPNENVTNKRKEVAVDNFFNLMIIVQ